MRIKKKDGKYLVESEHKKGHFYEVHPEKPFCNCPQFMFRQIKVHGKCKHIIAVEEYMRNKPLVSKKGSKKLVKTKETDKNKIIEYVKKNKEVDSIELIKKFGEDAVNQLIKQAELIEFKGKIKVLE